jgi:hypothetical protein
MLWEGGLVDVVPVPRIEGTLLFRPSPHIDDRGFFCRTFAIPSPLPVTIMSSRDLRARPLADAARLLA